MAQLRGDNTIRNIYLLVTDGYVRNNSIPSDCTVLTVDRLQSASTIRAIEENATAEYVMICLKPTPVTFGEGALRRMLRAAVETDAAMVYGDRYSVENGKTVCHPVIDYQAGSVRDDFDFGSLLLVKSSLLHDFSGEMPCSGYKYAGLYELRLYLSRRGEVFHLNEYLYTEEESDLRASGVRQFDYVNPANREVQKEMERAVTAHLREVGALVDTGNYYAPDFNEQEFEYEASVIIPVRNRVNTIRDAVESALSQKTDFPFNVIVVDNHSSDGTTELLSSLSSSESLEIIIPARTDLGIGGCWNVAVNDSRCGRFAVQLDSDDLYSSPDTLQQIVDAFHEQNAAMVIGSYRMCDFELNTLPPGLIDHAEWTDSNGCNNALRINGLGAPRAFFTPLLRQIQFPNTSYGEDYALGLAFSRHYRIGRIYKELYLCRRWSGNSDAALTVERVNANNLYKDRLRTMEIRARQQMIKGADDTMADNPLHRFFNCQLDLWDDANRRYRELHNVETREIAAGGMTLRVQFNPARIVSTGASIDKSSIASRPCFLCGNNRPPQQRVRTIDGKYELLVNPFPILPMHFTVASCEHRPQSIKDNYGEIYRLLALYPDVMVFYNGPKCGASAPDHMHFQAGTQGILPLQTEWQRLSRNLKVIYSLNDNENVSVVSDYPCPALAIRSRTAESGVEMFRIVYDSLAAIRDSEARVRTQGDSVEEIPLNIVSWCMDDEYLSVLFLRGKHRPDCYTADGEEQMLVSPGALDMAGLIITPRREDFCRITPEQALGILKEVSVTDAEMQRAVECISRQNETAKSGESEIMNKEPMVQVGIVSAEKIRFSLNKAYMAKGEIIAGEQEVRFSEGGILWNGIQYRELIFTPQSADASFSLNDVTIGVNFHWQRKETQTFQGTLRLIVEADKICAVNELPVENYLMSVISSEMKATSSLEFLKAHAVISRSWLLAQMEKRCRQSSVGNGFFSFIKKEDELIRWYDRDDHTIFDVCADDHCQRYQGITKASNRHVVEAVRETHGQILMYGDDICDARFSKCCGGVTEEFQYCWEDEPKPYLVSVADSAVGMNCGSDLSGNENGGSARKQGGAGTPHSEEDPFCNTQDKKILSQVLNDYDQETADFYRWTVEYTRKDMTRLIKRNLNADLGDILDLVPLDRGKSGRIWRLKIVGSKGSFIIGKELEIRRVLSNTHLYSSAFDVEKTDGKFILHGKGWGHGVGLCQIGAAVMGERGYKYDEILKHYYKGAVIKKVYK